MSAHLFWWALASQQRRQIGKGHKHQLVSWLAFAATFGNNHSDGRVVVEPFKLCLGKPLANTELATEILRLHNDALTHVAQSRNVASVLAAVFGAAFDAVVNGAGEIVGVFVDSTSEDAVFSGVYAWARRVGCSASSVLYQFRTTCGVMSLSGTSPSSG
jgi:hypothetical protein